MARPVCGGPDGTSALWPVPKAERGPGHRGGETALPGPTPDPARCLPLGHLVDGLLQQHARVEARSKGNFLCSQPRASSCREGCRERRLRALPRQSRPAGRSSLSPSASRAAPKQGANRVAPGRPRGARGTSLLFLPAWRSSARERCPGPIPGLRWSRLIGLARRLADVAAKQQFPEA